ncbi:MAG: biotin/lipoyl-containing protein, partial [Stenotrophomonas sp.]
MSQTKNFNLPDLGEGLPDATIVEWFVKEGDVIRLDEPLVSMETAKAVVEVPSPVSGKVLKLAGAPGDIVVTGHVLASFELDPNLPQRAEGQDTGHHHGAPAEAAPAPAAAPAPVAAAAAERADEGTVVGAMVSSNAVHTEQAVAVGGVKAMPAVRAMARKLGVDLARVRATGADGAVTMNDVKQAAANPSALLPSPSGTVAGGAIATAAAVPSPQPLSQGERGSSRTPLSAAGKPMRTAPPGVVAKGQPEPLKGVRRNMARVMADAHSKVVPTTLSD